MNELTTIAQKTDILFGLRPALEEFGFSPEEDIFLVFGYKDKEVKTEAISPILGSKTSLLNLENINVAIVDWLNKAEVLYEYSKVYGKELGIKGDGEFDITLKIVSESNELTMRNCTWYCPCFPGAGWCCIR